MTSPGSHSLSLPSPLAAERAGDVGDAAGPAAMPPALERAIVWGGTGLIAVSTVAAVLLNLAYGEAAFAARLIAGIAGCL